MNNNELKKELGYDPEEIQTIVNLLELKQDVEEIDEITDIDEEELSELLEKDTPDLLIEPISIEVSHMEMDSIKSLAVEYNMTIEKALYSAIALYKDDLGK
jgi:hypothetical protein